MFLKKRSVLSAAWLLVCLCGVAWPSRAWASDEKAPVSRGYTIPLIDLAADTSRQVIVDREQGQYLGHPTTVLLEDGKTLIVVYPRGHGRGGIILKRSNDGGRTWSDRQPVPANWSTSKETPTIHRVVDRSGKKRLIVFSGLYPIRLSVSEDDGQTWTPLSPIGDFGGIVAMSSVERLKNGDYLALFHDDGRFLHNQGKTSRFQVFKTVSRDGGLTWGAPEAIATHPSAHLCEPGLVRSPDGRQLAVLLRENSRKQNSFLIVSDDEGATWSAPRELPGALTGDRHVGKYAPDGRLFLSFRDTTLESSTRGDWVGWVGTYDDLIQGRQGQYRVRLMDNQLGADCAYPGVEVLPDGTIVATTYGHWTKGEPPYVVSVRLTLAELDALAKSKVKSKSSNGPKKAFDTTDRYEVRTLEGWTLLVNRDLLRTQPELAARALDRLRNQLYQVVANVPAGPVRKLRRVRIWVEEREGHHPCMAYHPDANWLRDHDMNPDKARCVEVADVRNFLDWTVQQPWMVLHELAHAYHHQFLEGGYENPSIRRRFEEATKSNLFQGVLRYDGAEVESYAASNPMEYFAESSEAYFGTNDFYPFVRAELRKYDPRMFALLKALWRNG